MKEIGSLHWIKSIEGLNFIKGNRCFIEDEEEAIEEGFTMKQIKRLQARIKKLGTMKCFEKFGWMEEHPLIVYVLDGKKYLGDGQGRGLYTTAYNTNVSEEIRKGNATENDYILIPVREYEVSSYKEMLDRVIVQNQYGTVWNKMELIQAECEFSGDKDVISGWNLVKRYSDELNIAEGVAADALFGQGSTKKDKNQIRLSHQRPYARQYLRWLGELYKECEKVGWNAKLLRRIHGTAFVKALQYNVFDKITRHPGLTDDDRQHYFNEAKKILLDVIPVFTVHQATQLSDNAAFIGANMLKILAKSKTPFFKEEFAFAKEIPNAFV